MDIKEKMLLLQKLKDATILNYLDDIDLDYEVYRYDSMISHLFHGDFDDILVRMLPSLKEYDVEDRDDILSIAKDYSHLCFFEGSVDNWLDSVENLPVDDYDFIAYRLLDHYIFLIDLVGSVELSQLAKISDITSYMNIRESSVIDTLRLNFSNDSLLKDTLILMSDENSPYSLLSDKEKAFLLSYPRENLFHVSSFEKINPVDTIVDIYNDMNHSNLESSDFMNPDVRKQIASSFQDEEKFYEIVMERNLRSDFQK